MQMELLVHLWKDVIPVATMLFQMGLGHPRDPLWFNPGHDRNDFFHFFQSIGGGGFISLKVWAFSFLSFLSFLCRWGGPQFFYIFYIFHFFHFFEGVGSLKSFKSFISFISLRERGPSILSILWGRGSSQFIYFFHFFHFFEGEGALNSFNSLRVWGLSILSILSFLWGYGDPQFFHFFEGVGTLNSFNSFISLRMWGPSILSFLWGCGNPQIFHFFHFFFMSLMPSNLSFLSNLWWCRGPQIFYFFYFFHFFKDGQNTNTHTVNITRINVKEAFLPLGAFAMGFRFGKKNIWSLVY